MMVNNIKQETQLDKLLNEVNTEFLQKKEIRRKTRNKRKAKLRKLINKK